MKLETTTVIDGVEVIDTGNKLMGHRIFTTLRDSEETLLLYILDSRGVVKSTLRINADCCQNTGYISDWSVKNH